MHPRLLDLVNLKFIKPEVIFTKFKAAKAKPVFTGTSQLYRAAANPARTMSILERSFLGVRHSTLQWLNYPVPGTEPTVPRTGQF